MVENNLQQINTWNYGMNLDTSDQFLPSSSYREAINLRLTTDTNSNTGTLHSIEGVKSYQDIISAVPEGYTNVRIIHTDTIRKYGIVLAKATKGNIDYYFIFRFINKAELIGSETGAPQLIFGPCKTTIGDNLSSVTRYEDEDNIKFYYADGINPLRTVNISPAIDNSRPMTDDGSFSIYPTALLSQPEFIALGIGNLKAGTYQYGYQLFTKNGAETEVSTLTTPIYPTLSSIQPTDSSVVKGADKGTNTGKSIQVKFNINDPKYDRIRIVSVYYEDTTSIPLIQVLQDLSIDKDESGMPKPAIYQDIDNKGISLITQEEFNMLTSVHFAPKVIESKNNFLFASDIKYEDNSFDVDYDARAYGFALDNNNALIAVLRSNTGQPEIVAARDSILNGSVVVPKDHDCVNPFSVLTKSSNSFSERYSPDLSTENAKCTYCKFGNQTLFGGDGINISYRFVATDLEEITDGTVSTDDGDYGVITRSQLAVARRFEGVWRYNITQDGTPANTTFLRLTPDTKLLPCNFSNPIIASRVKSLQRDEVYSYGIVFYNKFNQASPVKWIADIRVPDARQFGFETFLANAYTSFVNTKADSQKSALVVRPIGLEFIVKNLPKDVKSYEIVRCKREESDRATITQGIVGTTGIPKERSPLVAANGDTRIDGKYFPYPLNMGSQVVYVAPEISEGTITEADYARYFMQLWGPVTFSSPEVCFNYESFKNVIPKSDIRLTLVKHVFNNTSTGSVKDRGTNINISQGITPVLRKVTYRPFNTSTDRSYYIPQVPSSKDIKAFNIDLVEQSNTCYTMNGADKAWSFFRTSGDSTVIEDVLFPKEPSWKDTKSKFDFVDAIGGTTYINWCGSSYITTYKDSKLNDITNCQGPHGRSIILNTSLVKAPYEPGYFKSVYDGTLLGTNQRVIRKGDTVGSGTKVTSLGSSNFYNESIIGTQICNIRKDTIPYGGYTNANRQYRTYISTGSFTATLRDMNDNNIETSICTFSGDTFINLFQHIKCHYSTSLDAEGNELESIYPTTIVYSVPLESSINIAMKNSADIGMYTQIQPSNIENKYVQSRPLYSYNSTYSVDPAVKLHTPSNIYDEYNKHIDTRTYFSLNKNNDEFIDQWTKFKPLNYLDVDTRYGSINNLRTFGNELIFWQSNAVGKFSVNERTLISDDSNQPLMLGTGGVLSRYDYLATVNGIKHGHNDSDCQSDHVLYWFDYDKHELCQYRNGEVSCISKLKYVQTYLNILALTKDRQLPKPMCTYDKYYNEMIATLSKNESIVFSENSQIFTGFYTLVPDFNMYFNNEVYFSKGTKLYQYNSNTENNGFGDVPLPISLSYVVNNDYVRTKVFDNIEFTGFLNKDNLRISYQASGIDSKELTGEAITDRELNFRAAVPRASGEELFGNRMRGRALYCKLNYILGNSEATPIMTNKSSNFITTITNSDYVVTNINERSGAISDIRFELPYVRTTYRISKS